MGPRLASTFRASGRMVWPAGYLLCLAIFVAIERRFGARRLLASRAGVRIQLVDMWDGFEAFAAFLCRCLDLGHPLKSPFWTLRQPTYAKVRAISHRRLNHHWRELPTTPRPTASHDVAYLVASMRLALNTCGYGDQNPRDGSFEPNALYFSTSASAILARTSSSPMI